MNYKSLMIFCMDFLKFVSYFIVQLVLKLVVIYPDDFLSLFEFQEKRLSCVVINK